MNAWLTAIGVMLLSVASFWILHKLEVEERGAAASRPHEPDYYIEDMTRRTLGVTGELRKALGNAR